jgi:hypothetical protein
VRLTISRLTSSYDSDIHGSVGKHLKTEIAELQREIAGLKAQLAAPKLRSKPRSGTEPAALYPFRAPEWSIDSWRAAAKRVRAKHLSDWIRRELDLASLAPPPRGPTPSLAPASYTRGAPGRPLTVRATAAERERWEAAAAARGKLLPDWIRVTLNAAAGCHDPACRAS